MKKIKLEITIEQKQTWRISETISGDLDYAQAEAVEPGTLAPVEDSGVGLPEFYRIRRAEKTISVGQKRWTRLLWLYKLVKRRGR